MKKLLMLAMIALLACAFAVTISAAEIPEWTEITELDGMADKATFGADGTKGATSRVLMSDGVTYPAYYICKDSKTFSPTYTDINKASGKTYSASTVVRLEIPVGITTTSEQTLKTGNGYKNLVDVVLPEGVTGIAAYFFKSAGAGESKLTSVTIPSTVKTIGMQAFYLCDSLPSIVLPEGVETIGKEAFRLTTGLANITFPKSLKSVGELAFRDSNLSGGIVLQEGLETLDKYAFKGSGVTSAVIPSTVTTIAIEAFRECASLKTVVCKATVVGEYMFYSCLALENVTLENTVTISNRAFYVGSGSTGLIKELVLPDTLTRIEDYALIRQSLVEIVVPASVATIGSGVFQECSDMTRAVVLGPVIGTDMFKSCTSLGELVLTKNLKTAPTNPINGAGANFVTYYTGSNYDDIKNLITASDRITKASVCSYEDYLSGNYTENKYMFVCDANVCEVAFGGHLDDQNPCIVNCSRCEVYGVAERNPIHSEIVTMLYSGFDKAGEKAVVCTNVGCEHKVATAVSPLFEFLGHSSSEFFNDGITLGYVLNIAAIDEYEKITGNTLSYGVFAIGETKLNGGDVLNADGTLANGVLGAKVSGSDIGAFELKITGFRTEAQKDAKIIFGAYVIATKDGKMEFSFMQSGEPLENSKYYSASYNDIVG